MCVPCADDRLVGEKKQRRVQLAEEVRMEMAEEKLAELEDIQKAPGVTCGCCKGCPFILKRFRTTIENLFDGTTAKRIFARLLEWDHNDPLSKTQNVSMNYNKAKRLAEIAKCTLRCIFCHRLKTNKNGDGRCNNEPSEPAYTRKYFQDRLEWKKRRLAQTGKDGHCPGPGFDDIPQCPFTEYFTSFRQNLNTKVFDSMLEKEQLVMLLLYDSDHINKLVCQQQYIHRTE